MVPVVARFSGRQARSYLESIKPVEAPMEVEIIPGAFMFIRRETMEEVGMFDETFFLYSEDIDLCRRIKSAGWSIYLLPSTPLVPQPIGTTTPPTSFNKEPIRFSSLSEFTQINSNLIL